MNSPKSPKPTYRGVLHCYAFFAAIPAGVYLLAYSGSGPIFWSLLIYSISLLGLFGVSALYHRVQWSPRLERIMGTLDRTMIYAFIAGSITPFAVLAMTGTLPIVLLSVFWGAVLMGAFINIFWLDAPRWIHSLLYLAVSWAGVVAVPQLWNNLGLTALTWILAGGILYSIGGIVYAVQRPDPLPKVFGFHEVFHVFVTVAVAIHYGVIAQYLVPG